MCDSYITQRRSVAQADDAMDGLVSGICRYDISAPWQLYILTHCVAGVEHFGSGVMKGVTGIVTNPYKEAKKGGAGGAPPASTCRFSRPREI